VLLFASSGWRLRVAALLPVVVGAALAITAMPHQSRFVTDAIDPVAKELVCDTGEPQVCVSRVHSGLMGEVSPQARKGLAILATLPDAPTQVHEDTTTYVPDVYPPWHDNVVLLPVEAGENGHLLNQDDVLADVVTGAFASPPKCEKSAGLEEKLAAAYWLIGREPVIRETNGPVELSKAVKLWQSLRQLPADEATARVAALRQAALTCSVGDEPLSQSAQ
jgi:hypothetical protein